MKKKKSRDFIDIPFFFSFSSRFLPFDGVFDSVFFILYNMLFILLHPIFFYHISIPISSLPYRIHTEKSPPYTHPSIHPIETSH